MSRNIVFVNSSAQGDGTGADWYNAYTLLEPAIYDISTTPVNSGSFLFISYGNYSGDFELHLADTEVHGGYIVPDDVTSGNTDTSFIQYKSAITSESSTLWSGIYLLEGLEFITSSTEWLITNYGHLEIDNCDFNGKNIINNYPSGILFVRNSSAVGPAGPSGTFIWNNGIVSAVDSTVISRYEYGITNNSNLSGVHDVVIHHCNIGIQSLVG